VRPIRSGILARLTSDFRREHLRSLRRRLRTLREARRWSLKRLSVESGVSVAAIQKIESGETNPSLLTVMAIADVLGESVDRLVAASRKASEINHVVRGTLPVRTTGAALLPAIDQARIKSRLIALPARASLDHADLPKEGAVFAYVMDGSLQLRFADGTSEQLGTGDSIHVTGELPVEWINPLARRSVTLCVADRRPDLSGF
jgi:transcriptional regulator with XRE-family HTH domain